MTKIIFTKIEGDAPAIGLAQTLENVGFKMGRLKTGKFLDILFIHLIIYDLYVYQELLQESTAKVLIIVI